MITENQEIRQAPLFCQPDLRNILVAAKRILDLGDVVDRLPRDITRGELQLLTYCAVICEIVRGEFGEDGDDGAVGDLELKAQPYIPAFYQPKLRQGDNG